MLSRRDFLMVGTAAGAIVGGGVLVPLGFVLTDDDGSGATGARLASYPRSSVGRVDDLAVGEPLFYDYPFEGVSNVLVRMGEPVMGGIGPDRDIVSYSNQCTHMGCPVTDYDHEERVLGPCPCHYSLFDLGRDGIPALGQATQSLPRVLLEIDEGELFATGLFRLVYGHEDNLAGEQLVAVNGKARP